MAYVRLQTTNSFLSRIIQLLVISFFHIWSAWIEFHFFRCLCSSPGLCSVIGGRPKPGPLLRFFSYLAPKEQLLIRIQTSDGHEEIYQEDSTRPTTPLTAIGQLSSDWSAEEARSFGQPIKGAHSYPLSQLAWIRSGDKGDDCNIGVIAREPQFLPILRQQLTSDKIVKYFHHKFTSAGEPVCERFVLIPSHIWSNFVTNWMSMSVVSSIHSILFFCSRYDVPGVHALNFVLKNSLGGGGIGALNPDPQGKGYAQMLADFQITDAPKFF